MSRYHTVYKEVEIDVELDDFDDDDLIEELERRGKGFEAPSASTSELLTAIWLKRRVGRTDYESELDQLIYVGLGKVI
jgi:hypothetical protein